MAEIERTPSWHRLQAAQLGVAVAESLKSEPDSPRTAHEAATLRWMSVEAAHHARLAVLKEEVGRALQARIRERYGDKYLREITREVPNA